MVCPQCSSQLEITKEDEAFYGKLSIPAPLLCPDCRRQRRLAFRNERALYSRACDLCKKPTVSFYSPAYTGPVYCQQCWWSDGWDPFSYGRAYDSSRPFFDQLKELFRAVPQIAIFNTNSENSEFTAHSSRNKNCYLVISALTNEDCFYSFQITECHDVGDSAFARGSTQGYELIDCENMYNSRWCQKSTNCNDSSFLYDCHGCTNCFFSFNLRNKQYVFRNEQLSQKEYERKIDEVSFGSHETVDGSKKEFALSARDHAIHRYSSQVKCEQSTGNYLLNCKNAQECFDARNLEDCKYIVVSPGPTKDSYDCSYVVFGAELFCDVLSNVDSAMNQQYCQYSWASSAVQYCSYVMNGNDCFGSCGLRKVKFCILNKQYSEEEYTALRKKIIEDMRGRGEYGQFFPPALSAFGYNETIAQDEWPLTPEQARAHGFNWSEETSGRYDSPTREWSAVPDEITAVDESICKELFACMECKKNFKILKQELSFYKKMNVPLPRRCPDCRHAARMKLRGPNKLCLRQCMCVRSEHGHRAEVAPGRTDEGGSKCPNMFETTYAPPQGAGAGYAPDQQEKVFCEECYQKEIS